MKPTIAVTGCLPTMPLEFPLTHPENAGNMIHARAPMEMFPDAVYSGTPSPPWPREGSFTTWVNQSASHLIITLANFLQVGAEDGEPFAAFQRQLESLEAELVIFGLGAQAQESNLLGATMPKEAVELMKYLGDRCKVIGVRGQFTKSVFEHFAGVTNTYITGCPSLFSRPHALKDLRKNSMTRKAGLRAYAGTVYHRENETKMLLDSILNHQFLIEPVNRFNHQLHLDSVLRPNSVDIPWYLRSAIQDPASPVTEQRVKNYYSTYYRIFRNAESWYDFNREYVAFTYGSRFHVNMASFLSGVPAIWLTHDSRTAEMAEFLHLPSLPLESATQMQPEEISRSYDPTDFFDHIQSRFDNFSDFLEHFDLPRLDFSW